jgi:S1-C subfamily serine protease
MKRSRSYPHYSFKPQPEPAAPPSRIEILGRRLRLLYDRYRPLLLAVSGVIVALAAVLFYDLIKPDPRSLSEEEVAAVAERALEEAPPKAPFASTAYRVIRPSVVLVEALNGTKGPMGESSIGSGVVIVDSGIILTSLHVVMGASALRVIFADGSESEAVVLVEQPENDLAVLQALIIPDDLMPATLAGSAGLRIGDEVAAVGHPFGISNSLSAGVVSGLGRNYVWPETGRRLANLIQFDAAVNPGNSGGPLINRDGEVVGIVTALVNPTDEEFFVGIGLAVTIETAAGAAGPPLW